ncbi:MAG: hypothetical protein HZB53_10880 [Chloroflexi bacterium]|nr:hypothetical protein [Chloroflexota bacterium]
MAKPSRRERRRMGDKTPRAPRSAAPATMPHGASMEPIERVTAAPAPRSPAPALSSAPAQQYAHVKSDLVRIAVLATILLAGMIALRFILPQ